MKENSRLRDGKEVLSELLSAPKRADGYQKGLQALRFGVQVCMRRESLGLLQRDMEEFGIAQETMSRIEHGVRLPDTRTQPKLARALQARIIVEPDGQWRLEAVDSLRKAA